MDGVNTSGMEVSVLQHIGDVDPVAWEFLVDDDNPFVEHIFLLALERSGSVGHGTGWWPCHLVARDAGGRLLGAMPLYLKEHSYGEYVFDWSWAEAALSAGIPYYPKLVGAVPFTPVTGPRLLVHPAADPADVKRALLAGAADLACERGLSSVHVLFLPQKDINSAQTEEGWIHRAGYQFHWENRGYADFEAYLATFRSAARKNARRERRRAAASGLTLLTLRGEELSGEQWRALYRFYRDTSHRKWGRPYLNRPFFDEVRRSLAHRVVATLAQDPASHRPVAGALMFHKGRNLYGRYWGTLVDQEHLHFELCYYRPIDLCIQQGWTRFEAGAQGVHKLKRGLLPSPTYSLHRIHEPSLARAVRRFCAHEAHFVQREMATLAAHTPFRRDHA